MTTTQYRNLVTEVDRGVGIVSLSRPDRHNALDDISFAELLQALGEMETNPELRVVVLSSAGQTFCAGADLGWMQRAAASAAGENLRDAKVAAEAFRRLACFPKPTVARVHGPALGSGLGLVAACDVAVATFDAEFACGEARLGLMPAIVAPYVLAAMGSRHARRYMLTGERFTAAEAYRLGLIHEMVPDEAALDQAVGGVVEALLQGGPQALADGKDLLRQLAGRPVTDEVAAYTAARIARLRAGGEAKEGMAAFLAGRLPNWVPEV